MARSDLFPVFLALAMGAGALPQQGTPVERAAAPPATFSPQPSAGPGGSNYKDSAHFRLYNGGNNADAALGMLEATYDCFVNTLGWRSSGLSDNDESDAGPYYKTNIYTVGDLGGAAGLMHSEDRPGVGWVEVAGDYLLEPFVTVHEYGHAMHYHQKTWVGQGATGAWWETVGNWVSDMYTNNPLCADARAAQNLEEAPSNLRLDKVIGDSFQVIVDGTPESGNYYQAWLFLTYLTNNPDGFAGLGKDALHQMMAQYEVNSNETPLHVLQRIAGNATAGDIVGRYWARMAYVDIGHAQAKTAFEQERGTFNYASVDPSGEGYAVKAARAPRYMGANIIPLTVSGSKVEAKVTSSGTFTATLAIKGADAVRYVTLEDGAGSAEVASGEEASLVVANTPKEPLQYDGFKLEGSEANKGMDYSFTLTGATVASA